MIPCVGNASDTLDIRLWINEPKAGYKVGSRSRVPTTTDWNDNILTTSKLENVLHSDLIRFFENVFLFTLDVKSEEYVIERF